MLAAVKGSAYHAPMELRHLRSFVAVAEELHFRRAADRLHMAQPSVSQQMRSLEAELGVSLFERNRRGASLTAAGAALLPEARKLLAGADRAADIARATAAGQRGRLRLSLTRSLTGGIAGAIADAYRARYPDVELVLSVGNTMLHVEQLHRRRHRRRLRPAAARGPRPGGARARSRADGLRAPQGPPAGAARGPSAPARPARASRSSGGPRATGRAPGARCAARSSAIRRGPRSTGAEPEEERIVSAVAEGSGISVIMLERSRSLSIPGAVYRRFAAPEPAMGIAIAWRRGDTLPTLQRLRELAAEIAALR